MSKLTGKVAVVTGASKGIGAGIAKTLGREGAKVVVNYASDKAGAERVAAEIKQGGGEASVVGGSVAKTADVEALFAQVKQQFGKVDVLVNNAGIYAFSPIDQISEEQIDSMFGVNVKGLLLATKAAMPLFPPEGGSIVNISSTVTSMAIPASSIYTGTKGAVDVITRVLAKELGGRKVRVNTVSPGLTATEGNSSMRSTEMEQAMVGQTPLGRLGQPDDIADVVAFLASDDARWVTGEILAASGGLR
jgi:3-oxoacyl-[acyl-carrier protein] reductase